MQAFDYVAPSSVQEAVAVLAKHGAAARVLAGGTDIIIQAREGPAMSPSWSTSKASPKPPS